MSDVSVIQQPVIAKRLGRWLKWVLIALLSVLSLIQLAPFVALLQLMCAPAADTTVELQSNLTSWGLDESVEIIRAEPQAPSIMMFETVSGQVRLKEGNTWTGVFAGLKKSNPEARIEETSSTLLVGYGDFCVHFETDGEFAAVTCTFR